MESAALYCSTVHKHPKTPNGLTDWLMNYKLLASSKSWRETQIKNMRSINYHWKRLSQGCVSRFTLICTIGRQHLILSTGKWNNNLALGHCHGLFTNWHAIHQQMTHLLLMAWTFPKNTPKHTHTCRPI